MRKTKNIVVDLHNARGIFSGVGESLFDLEFTFHDGTTMFASAKCHHQNACFLVPVVGRADVLQYNFTYFLN